MHVERIWLLKLNLAEELIRNSLLPMDTIRSYYFHYGYLKGVLQDSSLIDEDAMYEIVKLLDLIDELEAYDRPAGQPN